MKNMKKMLSASLAVLLIAAGLTAAVPAQAASTVTLSTTDTDTLVDLTALGLSGSAYSIAQNASLSFQVVVPESAASTYTTILRGTTTGQLIKMDVVSSSGTSVFSKTHLMSFTNELFSGQTSTAADQDGAVMELAADTYTVTLTNTSAAAYSFTSLEFRNIILPLGSGLTAFHATDTYYQALYYDHSCKFNPSTYKGAVPEGATAVGGDAFYHVGLEDNKGPVLRYYIDAETAGKYALSVRTWGAGGVNASINGGEAVTIIEKVETRYASPQIDTYSDTVALNEGVNTLEISGGGLASLYGTGFDCFMLEFKEELAVEYADVTLNTQDTNTLVNLSALGLSGSSYSIAQNASLSFQVVVPETEASKYITILRGTSAECNVKMDVVSSSGTSVFSKTQYMYRANDLFAGAASGARDNDGAVMELAADTYTVTLTNTSATAFEFVSLEFRDAILPMGTEKTAFSVTDAYYQSLIPAHSSPYAVNSWSNTVPEGAKVVGSTPFYHLYLQAVNSGVVRMYIYAEEAGEYEISARTWGNGGLTVKANSDTAVTVAPYVSTAYTASFSTASEYITLAQGLNTLELTQTNGGVDTLVLEPAKPSVTLNTEDTNTLVDCAALGLSGSSYTIAAGKKVGFNLIVPETEASKYIAILRGNTTGPVLTLSVTDESGNAVFSKSQDIKLANDVFTGATGENADYDGGVMTLAAGTYTVTLTNTSETAYAFTSLEFRDVILPLGEELTAFHTTDAYYQNLLWWHTSRFSASQTTPEGAVAVGGDVFYNIIMQENLSPSVRFWVYAEQAGDYRLYIRTQGLGGITVSVNSGGVATVLAQPAETYTYRIDKYDGVVSLNQGLNNIEFGGGGIGGGQETSFDCFMLEYIDPIWGESDMVVTDVQEDSISVAWNCLATDQISAFELYKNGTLETTVASDIAAYTFSGLESGTSYELTVKAIFSDGSTYDTERTVAANTGGFLARENSFTQISAGRTHFIGINKNGLLQTFGTGHHGQASSVLNKELKTVAAGASSSYAVDTDGNLYSWGSNFYGQLGQGTEVLSVDVPTLVSGISDVAQVAAGKEHALALTASGEVYAWGNNRYGQLGCGDMFSVKQANAPVLVSALSSKGVVSVHAGEDTCYAISADGTLYSWGANYLGQLGNGNDALDNSDVPGAVTISGLKVCTVTGGGAHTAALCYSDANSNSICDADEDTSVWVWGADTRAQLASGDLGQWKNTPQRLTALDGADVIDLAAGDGHTLALTAGGAVYGWGWNEDGQLGLGQTPYAFAPTRITDNLPRIRAISAGYAYSVAIAENGRSYAWGANNAQQVIDSGVASCFSPVVLNLSLAPISFGNVKLANAEGETTESKPQTGGAYTVSADCYNDSESTFAGTVHICVYETVNGKPQLVSAVPLEITLNGKEKQNVFAEVSLPAVTDDTTVKIFAWDDAFIPYSDAAIVK